MDLGPKKYTSQIEVPCPTPVKMFTAVLTLSSIVVVVGGLGNKPIKTVETG